MAKCRRYLVVTGYVDHSKLFTRAYRLLSELSSTQIRVFEEARRITALIDADKFTSLSRLCRDHLSICMVEVKASCKLSNPNRLVDLLKKQGFTLLRGTKTIMAYGVVSGRIVEVEVASGGVKLKVGSRVSGDRVKPPVPGSLFSLDINEATQALEHLSMVLGLIKGVLYA